MLSSNISGATTFPGLQLKAWALVTAAGALVKGLNVASITKGATGIYTVNFSANLASVNYMAREVQNPSGVVTGTNQVTWSSKNVGNCNYTLFSSGANRDSMHYVEFWE